MIKRGGVITAFGINQVHACALGLQHQLLPQTTGIDILIHFNGDK